MVARASRASAPLLLASGAAVACIRELIPGTSASTRFALNGSICVLVQRGFQKALDDLLLCRLTVRSLQTRAFAFPVLFFMCTTRCNTLRSVPAVAASRRLHDTCWQQTTARAPAADVCMVSELAARVSLDSLQNRRHTPPFVSQESVAVDW